MSLTDSVLAEVVAAKWKRRYRRVRAGGSASQQVAEGSGKQACRSCSDDSLARREGGQAEASRGFHPPRPGSVETPRPEVRYWRPGKFLSVSFRKEAPPPAVLLPVCVGSSTPGSGSANPQGPEAPRPSSRDPRTAPLSVPPRPVPPGRPSGARAPSAQPPSRPVPGASLGGEARGTAAALIAQ